MNVITQTPRTKKGLTIETLRLFLVHLHFKGADQFL